MAFRHKVSKKRFLIRNALGVMRLRVVTLRACKNGAKIFVSHTNFYETKNLQWYIGLLYTKKSSEPLKLSWLYISHH